MLPLWPRPVWAEIDLNSFAFNIEQIHLKFPDKKILVAVKANAYGHGLVGISRYAEQNLPVDYLAVALIGEGITLRQAGIRMPILVFGGLLPEDIPYLFEYDLIPSIINPEIARRIDFYAQEHNRRIKAHLVVDTGMGRIGFYYQQAIEELLSMQALSHIEWEGIYTHFPSADEKDKCFTLEQIARLRRIIDDLAGRGFTFPLRHSFNSGAIIDLEDDYFNLVRPGVMAYGLYPSPEVDLSFPLKQVMTLKGRIVFLKEVEPGRTISYGRSWAPKERTIIATVPLGYGDGINRRFSNCGAVLVRGQRVPIVGRVTMDQIMIDLGALPDKETIALGEEVVIYGYQNGNCIRVEEVAELLQTITYEVTCWVSDRVPRVFIE